MITMQSLMNKIEIGLYVLSVFLIILSLDENIGITDYAIYYRASNDLLTIGFTNTYNYQYWFMLYEMPYRYFPFLLVLLFPLASMQLEASFYIFSTINLLLLFTCAVLIKRIMKIIPCDYGKHYLLNIIIDIIFFIFLPYQAINIGQITMIMAAILLCSFYCFLRGNNNLGSMLVGLTFVIKPTLFLLAIMIIIGLGKKDLIKRVMFFVIPLIPDAALFALNPGLMSAFLKLNLTGFVMNTERFASVSFINILYLIGDGSAIYQFVMLPIFTISIHLIIKNLAASRKISKNDKLLVLFSASIGSYIVIVPEAWPNQLFYVIVFMFLFIARFLKNNRKFLCLFFTWIFLIFFKYSITPNPAPPGFETLPWNDVLAIIWAIPLFFTSWLLGLITCALSLIIYSLLLHIPTFNPGSGIQIVEVKES